MATKRGGENFPAEQVVASTWRGTWCVFKIQINSSSYYPEKTYNKLCSTTNTKNSKKKDKKQYCFGTHRFTVVRHLGFEPVILKTSDLKLVPSLPRESSNAYQFFNSWISLLDFKVIENQSSQCNWWRIVNQMGEDIDTICKDFCTWPWTILMIHKPILRAYSKKWARR